VTINVFVPTQSGESTQSVGYFAGQSVPWVSSGAAVSGAGIAAGFDAGTILAAITAGLQNAYGADPAAANSVMSAT
jgi:hypothetical protein